MRMRHNNTTMAEQFVQRVREGDTPTQDAFDWAEEQQGVIQTESLPDGVLFVQASFCDRSAVNLVTDEEIGVLLLEYYFQ